MFSVGHVDPLVAVSAERSDDNSARYLQPFGRWLHLLGLIMLTGPIVMLLVLVHSGDAVVAQRLWRLSRLAPGYRAGRGGDASRSNRRYQWFGLPRPCVVTPYRRAADPLGNAMGDARFYSRRADRVDLSDGAPPSVSTSPSSAGLIAAIVGLAVLILATALNGHSAATPPVVLSVAIDWFHLAATGVWVGGLLSLSACVLPWTGRLPPERRREMLARVVSRFSNMSLAAVEVLILTGLYHTWAHVSGPEALSTHAVRPGPAGESGLDRAALVPAAVNLFIVRPQLAAPADDAHVERSSKRLGRLIRSEAVVAVGILGAAAMLTSLPPAQLLAAPGQPSLSRSGRTTGDHVCRKRRLGLREDGCQLGAGRLEPYSFVCAWGKRRGCHGAGSAHSDRGCTRHRRVHLDGDAGGGSRRLRGHGGSGPGRTMDAARSRHRRLGGHIQLSPSGARSRGDPRIG